MATTTTTTTAAASARTFTFDHCLLGTASQHTVYETAARGMLDHALEGYNVCILAYGQTASGKTHTMLGDVSATAHGDASPVGRCGAVVADAAGIVPRACHQLFEAMAAHEAKGPAYTFCVEATSMEIYNERARDLLNPGGPTLRIREHPIDGPFVEDLTRVRVRTLDDIQTLLALGATTRTTAATAMNDTSSRSHAILTLYLTV
ncbi:P-loop containing nucleoside triphosphate hydrolase protein, partial [Caulochytrium protostelioides]